MTATIQTTEPTSITPGDTVKWTRSLPDYPASAGWVLSYELVKASTRITITASSSGDNHLVTVAAATSTNYTAGDYAWRARVTKSGEVYTVGTGRVTILPSFASATDARSQARRALEAIESMLEGRASSAVMEYEIAGRRLRNYPIPELLTLRDRYRQDVAREDAAARSAANLPSRTRILVRHG